MSAYKVLDCGGSVVGLAPDEETAELVKERHSEEHPWGRPYTVTARVMDHDYPEAVKKVKADERGRVNLGTDYADAEVRVAVLEVKP